MSHYSLNGMLLCPAETQAGVTELVKASCWILFLHANIVEDLILYELYASDVKYLCTRIEPGSLRWKCSAFTPELPRHYSLFVTLFHLIFQAR